MGKNSKSVPEGPILTILAIIDEELDKLSSGEEKIDLLDLVVERLGDKVADLEGPDPADEDEDDEADDFD